MKFTLNTIILLGLLSPIAAATDSLVVDTTGKVGIGTATPEELLDVTGDMPASNVKFKVENVANGGNSWAFSVSDGRDAGNASELRVSKQGTGGPEFTVNQRLDGNATGDATLVIAGSIEATNVTFTSSRKLKTDFNPVDTQDVLNRVSKLEMSTWRYKEGSPGKHIGPIAEDFEKAFKLGNSNDKISIVDANGVALAAIQALYAKTQSMQNEIVKLQSQLDQVK